MPVRPRFQLRQDSKSVFLEIRVPYVRVADMEITVDGKAVSFHCKPYLLRLKLPHPVIDDERTRAVYDPNVVRTDVCGGGVCVDLPCAACCFARLSQYALWCAVCGSCHSTTEP